MLLEELGEGRNRDIEGVVAIVLGEMLDLRLALETLRQLEGGERGFLVDGVD